MENNKQDILATVSHLSNPALELHVQSEVDNQNMNPIGQIQDDENSLALTRNPPTKRQKPLKTYTSNCGKTIGN